MCLDSLKFYKKEAVSITVAPFFSVAHDAVADETSASTAAQTDVNVPVEKKGGEKNEGVQTLAAVLKSDAIKQFITDTCDGAAVPFGD